MQLRSSAKCQLSVDNDTVGLESYHIFQGETISISSLINQYVDMPFAQKNICVLSVFHISPVFSAQKCYYDNRVFCGCCCKI